MDKKDTQGNNNKVEIIKDLIDMNNDGKITDDIPKILAFLASFKGIFTKMLGSSNKVTKK